MKPAWRAASDAAASSSSPHCSICHVSSIRDNSHAACGASRPSVTASASSSDPDIRGIAQFVASLGREIPVELLNFNPMCREKYESLRQRYEFDPNQREIAQERVDALKQILTDHGLRTL